MMQLPEILTCKKIKLKQCTKSIRSNSRYKKRKKRSLSLPPLSYKNKRKQRINQYTILDQLGSGHFGTTYTVCETQYSYLIDDGNIYNTYTNDNKKHCSNNTRVLKRIICNYKKKKIHEARKEARILAHVPQSPYLLTIFDFFEWQGDYCIVTNYCSGGTLFDFIRKKKVLEPFTIFRILHDCLKGLTILHDHKPSIVHRDLKPDNIFCNNYGQFVLGDMGLSRLVKIDTLSYTTSVNYIAYQSPEIIQTGKYTIISDIWCMGGVLLCMLTKNPSYLEEYLYKNKETLGSTLLRCRDYIDTIISDEHIPNIFHDILHMCFTGSIFSVKSILETVNEYSIK